MAAGRRVSGEGHHERAQQAVSHRTGIPQPRHPIALVEQLDDVRTNMLPWLELQAWRGDAIKDDWEKHRQCMHAGADKRVCLAGVSDSLVENTVNVVKKWLVCAAPRPASECAVTDELAL